MSISTIQYQTNASDKFVATKQDGMVNGGNNGVQMTSPEMQDFVKNQNNVSLERTPQNDSVTLKGVSNQQEQIQYNFTLDDIQATEKKYNFKKKFLSSTYKMTGKGVDLTIKDGFLGGRTIKGTVDGKDVNLKLKTDFGLVSSDKVKISGQIGNDDVKLAMKPKLGFWGDFKEGELSGEMNSRDKNLLPIIASISENRYMIDYVSTVAAMSC